LSYEDRTLICADCQTTFVFSAAEQEFYAKKGFTNDPKRCPECRAAKKQRVGAGREPGAQRQAYPAVCAACGKETQVPLSPATAARFIAAIVIAKLSPIAKPYVRLRPEEAGVKLLPLLLLAIIKLRKRLSPD